MNCKRCVKHHLINLDSNNHVIVTHTYTGEHRDTIARGSLNNIQLLPDPSQEPSSANLSKPKEEQRHKGRHEAKLRTQRKGHPVQTCFWAVPGELQP